MLNAERGSLPRGALAWLVVGLAIPAVAEESAIWSLSTDRLEAVIAQATKKQADEVDRRVVVSLPTAEGGLGRFAIDQVSVMEADLAARFPRIRTYRGIGLDDHAAVARLDLTPRGFHAMVLSPAGTVLIEPDGERPLESSRVLLPHRVGARAQWQCATLPRRREAIARSLAMRPSRTISGPQIRTFRIGIAATGEYTTFHGGTVENGLAEVVTVLNRVDGILERDAAIRLRLVDANDRLIYTEPETDPYTNDEPSVMSGENQVNLDRVIGSENYDIGHVFGTYPQGRADGRACEPGRKGMGVSGLPRPTTEFFATQLVAHEIGHQFNASHTYNGTTGVCGSYRHALTAWEPGSGSTIMSYAGVCADENMARVGDDYFHTGSMDEILAYISPGGGGDCGSVAGSGNRPPTADAGRRYRIPVETPFTLSGSGSDPDGDALTYIWEQFDLGPASPPLADDGQRPLFRSYPPTAEPIRVIPRVRDLRRGRATIKEILPTTTRKLTFRLTVRDGRGGVTRDTVKLQVKNQAGPFRVLEPRRGDLWTPGGHQVIEWEVAGTDRQPIRCRRVDLWLSSDGGRSFPVLLLEGTLNDGLERVTVPSVSTGEGRIKVSCSNNIFFALSEGNHRIRE